MRFLSVLLALYVLALDAYPCMDHDLWGGGVDVWQESVMEHEHQGGDWTAEACSPFCACSCCGMMVDVHHLFSITLSLPVMEGVRIPVSPSYKGRDVFFSVWRPPQPTV